MSSEIDKRRAKSIINNGRMLIIVTALPFIGSLIKFFYKGELNTENPIILLIGSFPTISLDKLFTLDHFIILGFLIGLIVGISTLKRGIQQIIELEK